MRKVLEIPDSAKKVINEFQNLPLGGKSVICPYFINIRKQRAGLRVLVGKGDPGEIIREVIVTAKYRGIDLGKMSSEQIREFMQNNNIGIECSGFVVHVLNYWLHQQGLRPLVKYLKFPNNNPIQKLKRLLRPVENISSNLLTSELNCQKIENLNEMLPGDLIRLKGRQKNASHVLLVTKVILEDEKIVEFSYVESSRDYGKDNGIRESKVLITDSSKGLREQHWLDVDLEHKRNWTYENLLKEYEDNGVRRIKNLMLKIESN